MAYRSFATSVNTILGGAKVNVHNARIHYGTEGWVQNDNGVLVSGTEKRRVVLFPGIKPSPTTPGVINTGVTYNYDSIQRRTVKAVNGDGSNGRIVFSPAHL